MRITKSIISIPDGMSFLTQFSSEWDEQSGNNTNAVLIIRKTMRSTGDAPGCIAGAKKIQVESENISLKFKCRLILECKFLKCLVAWYTWT